MHEFILGFICCEFIILTLNTIIDIKQQKKDMKELERMNENVETDLRFSTKVCESIQKINTRLDKLEGKEEK